MRIQTEYMSFKNCWMISSSYDFQAHQQCSQRRWCFSQTAVLWFEVLPDMSPALPDLPWALPGAPKVLSGAPRCSQTYHNHSYGTPVPVIRDPSYSKGRLECPPRVWYSPEIDPSKFTLHILSDTPGVFQWLQYILLMRISLVIRTSLLIANTSWESLPDGSTVVPIKLSSDKTMQSVLSGEKMA